MAARMLGHEAADQLQLLRAEGASAVAHHRQAARCGAAPGGAGEARGACPVAAVPGQEALKVLLHPTAGGGACIQVLGQPGARVDLPQLERVEQAEQRGVNSALQVAPEP